MSTFNLRHPGRAIHVGVILLDGMTEILDIAPIDLIHGLTKEFVEEVHMPNFMASQAIDIDFHWVNENGTLAKLTSGMTVQATDSFATCPPLDIILMGALWHHTPTETELAFVRKAYADCSACLTICGGMYIPLAAGVLKGKTCTAPVPFLEELRQEHSETNWVEKRYVKDADGKTWTSGVLLNGLDLMKAFVQDTWGGPGTLADEVIKMGSWPVRASEYRDGDDMFAKSNDKELYDKHLTLGRDHPGLVV